MEFMGSGRGSRRTTAAMLSAPMGCVFIWCNDRLEYPKRLAKSLGRSDLKIVSPFWLENGWKGERFTGIVADHHLELGEKRRELFRLAILRVGG